MKTSILTLLCVLGLIISPACASYDTTKAQQYEGLFSAFVDANVGCKTVYGPPPVKK
jgi:hypothetical protein